MTDEHKKALAEGRKKYWVEKHKEIEAKHAEEKALADDPCSTCITIDWFAKRMGKSVDRDHCPIKCRYNKEVKNNANNE